MWTLQIEAKSSALSAEFHRWDFGCGLTAGIPQIGFPIFSSRVISYADDDAGSQLGMFLGSGISMA